MLGLGAQLGAVHPHERHLRALPCDIVRHQGTLPEIEANCLIPACTPALLARPHADSEVARAIKARAANGWLGISVHFYPPGRSVTPRAQVERLSLARR